MSGLGVGEALAHCSNLSVLCSNQHTDCSLVGTVIGNFSGCSYAGRNFHGMNLSGDCFEGTDFTGANLSSANLSGDNLVGANLAGANLNRASLASACLQGANLAGANLNRADLSGADLTNANFNGANLRSAVLNGVIWLHTTCPDGTNSDDNGGTCLLHLK
jgi:uncharacterized protein YjbI with pentapeptide repeats